MLEHEPPLPTLEVPRDAIRGEQGGGRLASRESILTGTVHSSRVRRATPPPGLTGRTRRLSLRDSPIDFMASRGRWLDEKRHDARVARGEGSQVEAIVEAIDAAKPTATQRRVASKCARAVESIANVTAGRPVGRHVVDLDARTSAEPYAIPSAPCCDRPPASSFTRNTTLPAGPPAPARSRQRSLALPPGHGAGVGALQEQHPLFCGEQGVSGLVARRLGSADGSCEHHGRLASLRRWDEQARVGSTRSSSKHPPRRTPVSDMCCRMANREHRRAETVASAAGGPVGLCHLSSQFFTAIRVADNTVPGSFYCCNAGGVPTCSRVRPGTAPYLHAPTPIWPRFDKSGGDRYDPTVPTTQVPYWEPTPGSARAVTGLQPPCTTNHAMSVPKPASSSDIASQSPAAVPNFSRHCLHENKTWKPIQPRIGGALKNRRATGITGRPVPPVAAAAWPLGKTGTAAALSSCESVVQRTAVIPKRTRDFTTVKIQEASFRIPNDQTRCSGERWAPMRL
ncbi:hypothetical protein PCL_11936 [Purpureocillium lilacinum]|uniref:Uncharacterized protein n=1 Tax=Purpureocillium lilacinum TaxID=33203 RepID=A0A2U3EBH2_PURLI|nr:hypothetical protein PCL_11936 [Purpureocillium lilacinum]